MTEVKPEVKVGQQFDLGDLGKFRVSKLHGKEAALVLVGTKTGDATHADGTLRFRRVTTLEALLAKRAESKAPAKPAAVVEPAGDEVEVDESDAAQAA